MTTQTHFGCDGCDELIPLAPYAVAQLAQNNPISYQHKREKGGCGVSTYLDPHKYRSGEPMGSTKEIPKQCDVEGGCTTGKPYAARGKCQTHYMQLRRFERGEGRAPGEVKQIAAPGEALDQAAFKLPAEHKARIAKLAEREGVDASDLYREAVELLLADRKLKRRVSTTPGR